MHALQLRCCVQCMHACTQQFVDRRLASVRLSDSFVNLDLCVEDGLFSFFGVWIHRNTLMLLLFASTKFCDLGVPMILQVLIFAISRSRAKFCDFAQPRYKLNFKIHLKNVAVIDWIFCNVVFVLYTRADLREKMPNGAACTRYPVRTKFSFARDTPTVDIIKRHFCKLVMARERSKERLKRSKENDYACSKVANITQFVIAHTQECQMCR